MAAQKVRQVNLNAVIIPRFGRISDIPWSVALYNDLRVNRPSSENRSKSGGAFKYLAATDPDPSHHVNVCQRKAGINTARECPVRSHNSFRA